MNSRKFITILILTTIMSAFGSADTTEVIAREAIQKFYTNISKLADPNGADSTKTRIYESMLNDSMFNTMLIASNRSSKPVSLRKYMKIYMDFAKKATTSDIGVEEIVVNKARFFSNLSMGYDFNIIEKLKRIFGTANQAATFNKAASVVIKKDSAGNYKCVVKSILFR